MTTEHMSGRTDVSSKSIVKINCLGQGQGPKETANELQVSHTTTLNEVSHNASVQ